MFSLNDLLELEHLIIRLSDSVLLPYLNKTKADIKNDGSIVTEADLSMQQAVHYELISKFGDHIALLGEECDENEQERIVANENRFWVLDPLDGTTNFHAAFPIFCTSLAFIKDNEVILGITYDPVRQECFSALKGHGFFYNRKKTEINSNKVPDSSNDSIAFIDFKRLSQEHRLRLIQTMPFKSQRNIGSSALEWAWLAMNRANISFHGGQKLWDYAAGSLLLSEAGGYSQDFDGKPLYQSGIEVRPVIAATSKSLCQKWLQEF